MKHIQAVSLLTLALATTANAQSVITLFTYPNTIWNNTGVQPPAEMSQGPDGELYGTIRTNGNGNGAAFKITTLGAFTTLYDFCQLPACLDGSIPNGGLTLGADGDLYGTTANGGKSNVGTIFKLTPSGTLTKLYDFTSFSDGGYPAFTVFQAEDGNFYGVNPDVYAGDFGLVFRMTPSGKLTVLGDFNFTNGDNPSLPTQGTDGNFYGTTQNGGDPTCRCGVIYKMTPAGKLTVLHNFTGYPGDGNRPYGQLVQGSDGDFYGVTYQGGTLNIGTIFKVTAAGAYSLVYSFAHSITDDDGAQPFASLTLGSDNNLYGTTTVGGKNGYGTIFRLTPGGQYTMLYSFCSSRGCTDGIYPFTPLVQHTNGKFSGNTSGNSLCCGTFYSLDMGLPPFTRPTVSTGKIGATVTFLGQGFTGTTAVSFNGTPAPFTVVSDSDLTATVPAGASSGPVTVTTPGGTLIANRNFQVAVSIVSFSPPSGPVGTSVTITGASFTGATRVTFGGVKATTFTVNSDNQITATVPAGAKTGKVQVTAPTGAASSATNFTVTL